MNPLFELALAMKAAHRALERLMNDALEPLGVTDVQADALVVIGQAGPLSLKDLGDLLIAEAGHPSRLVDRLVEAGLVAREPLPEDRRHVVLTLTSRGRERVVEIERIRTTVLDFARGLLGDRDIAGAQELIESFLMHTPYREFLDRRRRLSATAPAEDGTEPSR
ncbi:MarR family winged helix-turn-helix transcriptional regulator [Nocardia sp. NPDC049526]|uniref:MarR family winged helix-turn-helix transcriptional regulator n=1 Tax=Nocardia sp. NPDC049526 TaxID=3364316 RepID=UPI00379E173C